MEWKIIIHDVDGYAEVITSGVADRDGSLNMAEAIAKSMRSRRITRVCIDHRNIEDVAGGAFDIYERPKIWRLIGVILRIKIAEVIKPVHWDHFHFFETVCRNRGYQLSIFQTKDEALAWLLA